MDLAHWVGPAADERQLMADQGPCGLGGTTTSGESQRLPEADTSTRNWDGVNLRQTGLVRL